MNAILCSLCIILSLQCDAILFNSYPKANNLPKETKYFDWELLIDALQIKESNNNPLAINTFEDAVGVLQIRPIYVSDINRIVGYNKYKLKDRYNIQKSREMVKIFFSYYLKDENIEEIIAMHCAGPKAKHKLKENPNIQTYYISEVMRIKKELEFKNDPNKI